MGLTEALRLLSRSSFPSAFSHPLPPFATSSPVVHLSGYFGGPHLAPSAVLQGGPPSTTLVHAPPLTSSQNASMMTMVAASASYSGASFASVAASSYSNLAAAASASTLSTSSHGANAATQAAAAQTAAVLSDPHVLTAIGDISVIQTALVEVEHAWEEALAQGM